mmetsp:Transcript_24413/g.41814  ORF Transcript_24413/g.41814 Transcript_24413/m.41814 type:complete len:94 (+) Transcript_24413:373-654(+)
MRMRRIMMAMMGMAARREVRLMHQIVIRIHRMYTILRGQYKYWHMTMIVETNKESSIDIMNFIQWAHFTFFAVGFERELLESSLSIREFGDFI